MPLPALFFSRATVQMMSLLSIEAEVSLVPSLLQQRS